MTPTDRARLEEIRAQRWPEARHTMNCGTAYSGCSPRCIKDLIDHRTWLINMVENLDSALKETK